jgi:rhodanese-related sulfurtransferase
MTIEQALVEIDSIIVDVRTYEEFQNGNVAGSINIPLSNLQNKLNDIKQYKTIVLCCETGRRSQIAFNYLNNQDIESIDGGSWLNINNIKNNLNE